MPTYGPTTRVELTRALKNHGFQGPYSGGKHQFMTKGSLRRGFRIRIAPISALNFLAGSWRKLASRAHNGKNYK